MARLGRSGRHVALRGGEVAGAARVAAVGERRPCPAPRCGARRSRAAAAPRRACGGSGSWSRSQRSLVDRERGDRHAADRVGARLRAAELVDQVAGRGAERVSFQSSASRTGVAGVVEGDHAVLLPADGDRRGPVEQPGPAACVERGQPGPRVDLGAGRVRRGPLLDDLPSRRRPAAPWSTGWRSRRPVRYSHHLLSTSLERKSTDTGPTSRQRACRAP